MSHQQAVRDAERPPLRLRDCYWFFGPLVLIALTIATRSGGQSLPDLQAAIGQLGALAALQDQAYLKKAVAAFESRWLKSRKAADAKKVKKKEKKQYLILE